MCALGPSGTAGGGVGTRDLGVDVADGFLDLCFFPSFVTAVGVAVPELGGEGVFNCGANALASTRAISFSSQC